MARTALDVLPLDRAKRGLGIEPGVTDEDVTLAEMIGSAVSYLEAATGRFFIQRRLRYPIGQFPGAGGAIVVTPSWDAQLAVSIRYYTAAAPRAADPDGVAQIGHSERNGEGVWLLYPSGGAWPTDRNTNFPAYIDFVVQVRPLRQVALSAIVSITRHFFEGLGPISAVGPIKRQLRLMSQIPVAYIDVSESVPYYDFGDTPLTPVIPPVTPPVTPDMITVYTGTAASVPADGDALPALTSHSVGENSFRVDVNVSIQGGHYLIFLVPAGHDLTEIYFVFAGGDNPRRDLFTRTELTLGGDDYVMYSRGPVNSSGSFMWAIVR